MPRLSRQLLSRAWKRDSLLPPLLQVCRDLESAQLELKWLREHINAKAEGIEVGKGYMSQSRRLRKLCEKRSKGYPLQYILGSEYFGKLSIRCEPGVLIPRQETAAALSHLLNILQQTKAKLPNRLRFLDLCTGTGCIALLFGASFPFLETAVEELEILGVDVSRKATSLAQLNRRRLIQQLHRERNESKNSKVLDTLVNTRFLQADILAASSITKDNSSISTLTGLGGTKWDIIVSNPPYISPRAFMTTTSRSVRYYEPKLALVPGQKGRSLSDETAGDLFYPRILQIARQVESKIVLVEVADMAQAERVAQLALAEGIWDGVEIWRDDPRPLEMSKYSQFGSIKVIGQGSGRSVMCWRHYGGTWLGRTSE